MPRVSQWPKKLLQLLAPLLFLVLLALLLRPRVAPIAIAVMAVALMAIFSTLFRAFISVTEVIIISAIIVVLVLLSREGR
ncbi:hypothetical protein [Pyrolobus fumarii]|uniref:hypothetical protein n=1 Tax=Pyrolobus fumarii TaxID=54252 RepID=UPI001432D4EB|nr:hypothetical protein [Pyrolobus fumarii]